MLTLSTYRHRHRILPRHPGQPEEGLGGPHPEAGVWQLEQIEKESQSCSRQPTHGLVAGQRLQLQTLTYKLSLSYHSVLTKEQFILHLSFAPRYIICAPNCLPIYSPPHPRQDIRQEENKADLGITLSCRLIRRKSFVGQNLCLSWDFLVICHSKLTRLCWVFLLLVVKLNTYT